MNAKSSVIHQQEAYLHKTEQSKIAIIAGGLKLPKLLVEVCQKAGRPYYVIGIKGDVDQSWINQHPHTVLPIGKMGAYLKTLRKVDAKQVVMAGSVSRPENIGDLDFDLRGAWWFWQLQRYCKKYDYPLGDETLHTFLSKKLQDRGYEIIGPYDLLPEIMTEAKVYTKQEPDSQHWALIARGAKAARSLGLADKGQAVVITKETLFKEDHRGTDALMQSIETESDAVLVKTAKPGQTKAIDLPTIGLQTVQRAVERKLAGIAVEAGQSYFIDAAAAVKEADKKGLFIVGFSDDDLNESDIDE